MFMDGRPQTVFQSGRRPAGLRRSTAGPGQTGSGEEELLSASLHPKFPESISETVVLQKVRRGRPSIKSLRSIRVLHAKGDCALFYYVSRLCQASPLRGESRKPKTENRTTAGGEDPSRPPPLREFENPSDSLSSFS